MSDRRALLRGFLARAGCDTASMTMIAGDASNRKYYRLARRDRSVVAMDAPPEKGEDVRPFIRIANWLGSIGLSAPFVFMADEDLGFLLLEDLGNDLYARLFETGHPERPLYIAAADVLWRLHITVPPLGLDPYTPRLMAELAALSVVWYLRGQTGSVDEGLASTFTQELERRLAPLAQTRQVIVLRDYHAENLIWLPSREGIRRVGLLDFQDAMSGHPAYDLVSILQDARRDVDPGLASDVYAHFVRTCEVGPEFQAQYSLLGLQRNLRILGVFARLCLRDGKAGYVDLIPRVWGHIVHNLEALEEPELTRLILQSLPAPDGEMLRKLKSQCA
jgi:aminoglycoside/choline kinase family phosphotransferase